MSEAVTMNVSITKDLDDYVKEVVSRGGYTSQSEVIREALRFYRDYEAIRHKQLNDLNEGLKLGMAQLANGEGITFEEHKTKMKKRREST